MRKSLWTAALATTIILVLGAGVSAADYTYAVTGTDNPPIEYKFLKNATNAANAQVGVGKNAIINLSGNNYDSKTTPGGTGTYYGFLDGDNFGTVRITATTAGDRYKIAFSTPSDNLRLFGFNNTGIVEMTNLELSNGNVTRNAGLAAGGGTGGSAIISLNEYDRFYRMDLNNMSIHGNSTLITQYTAGGHMAAGAILVDGKNSGGVPAGSFHFTDSELRNNTARMDNGSLLDVWSNASGGGARLVNVANVIIDDSTVSGNIATLAYGNHAVGGGLDIEADGSSTASISKTTFSNNRAEILNHVYGTDRHHASGGAVYFYNSGIGGTSSAISQSRFIENVASAVNSIAQGGAIHYESLTGGTIADSAFESNRATSTSGSAQGGAVSIFSTHDADGVVKFTKNTFWDNQAQGESAFGGAVYSRNSATFAGDVFKENRAVSSDGDAYGGALVIGNWGSNRSSAIANAEFTGNQAVAGGGSSLNTVSALGGAIYLDQGGLTVTDTNFVNNSVRGQGAWSEAKGGAIFVNTDVGANPSRLNLVATATGGIRIAGNRANGRSSGIHFGAATTGVTLADSYLNIAANGTVELLDPIKTETGAYDFTMTKTGAGDFFWNGENSFDSRATVVDLQGGGRLSIGDTFTAKAQRATGSYTVMIADNTAIDFRMDRRAALAMFDFTAIADRTRAVFETGNNVTISTQFGRQLLSVNTDYLVAAGLSAAEAADAVRTMQAQGAITDVFARNGNVYANVKWDSPLDQAGVNTNAVKDILNQMAQDENMWSDAQIDYIRRDPWSLTPELYMDSTTIMLNATDVVARAAVKYGLIQPERHSQYYQSIPYISSDSAYGAVCDDEIRGARLWMGYVGDFYRLDEDAAFAGFTTDRNGFVVGLNYDFGAAASVGVYGGYTRGEIESKRARSTIKSNNGHFGLIARVTPLENLSFYADGGWATSSNDMYRSIGGGRASSTFEQDVLTAGLAVEYAMCYGGFNIVPQIKARYSHIYQGKLNEKGFTATAVESFNRDAFNTRMGFELSRDVAMENGVITPAVNVAWRHEYGNRMFDTTATYIEGPSYGRYVLSSSKMDRTSADIGAALRASFEVGESNLLGLNMGYNFNISRHSSTHSLFGGFEIGF